MSTHLSVRHDFGCPPEHVRQRLMDPAVLRAFVDKQHPDPESVLVEVDRSAGTSHLTWTWIVQGSLPAPAAAVVGPKVTLDLIIRPDIAGDITLTAKARREATMTGSLSLMAEGGGSVVSVEADIDVGAFPRSMLERLARDQVLVPILREDLFPLLCDHPEST